MSHAQNDVTLKSLFIPLSNLKASLIIVFVGLVVYFNALFNSFVWDDLTYIIFNPQVHSVNIPVLFGQNLFNMSGQYRPIPALYFSVLFSSFQVSPFFYHFLSFVFHVVNAYLLFILFKKFFIRELSLILALGFLVHPVQTESVSYIAAAGNLLFFLFGITALLVGTKEKLAYKEIILISALLLLAALTKETGILFFLLIPLYKFLFNRKDMKLLIIGEIGAFLIYLSARLGLAGIHLEKLEMVPIATLSLIERMVSFPAIIFYYIKTFLFPVQLAVAQLWVIREINFSDFFLPLFLVLIFFLLNIIVGVKLHAINRKLFHSFLFFFAWLLLGLGLHSQIFPTDWTVADRWFYFPIVGFLGLMGGAFYLFNFSHKNKQTFLTIAVIVLIILSIRTMVRNANWQNGVTLFSNDVQHNDNYDTRLQLGAAYGLYDRRYKEAIPHFKKSVEHFPYEGNNLNIGYMYQQLGDTKTAKKYYLDALNAKNYSSPGRKHGQNVYQHLGLILALSDDPQEAQEFILGGLEDYPNDGSLWAMLAICEYKLGNRQKALASIEKAKLLLPNNDQVKLIYSQITSNQPINLNPTN